MRYDVTHTTEYDYSESVAVAHHVARLSRGDLPHQECLHHELAIEPAPAVTSTHEDYFGNLVTICRGAGRAHEPRDPRPQHRDGDRSGSAAANRHAAVGSCR